MRMGFPCHMDINDFFNTFKHNFDNFEAVSNDKKNVCGQLVRSCGLSWTDFKIGNTKIFLRNGKKDIIDEKLNADLELIVKRYKNLKILRAKFRFAIIFIVKRCGSLKKNQPIQGDSVFLMANDAEPNTELVNSNIEEVHQKSSKKRKMNIQPNATFGSKSPRHVLPSSSSYIESKFIHIHNILPHHSFGQQEQIVFAPQYSVLI